MAIRSWACVSANSDQLFPCSYCKNGPHHTLSSMGSSELQPMKQRACPTPCAADMARDKGHGNLAISIFESFADFDCKKSAMLTARMQPVAHARAPAPGISCCTSFGLESPCCCHEVVALMRVPSRGDLIVPRCDRRWQLCVQRASPTHKAGCPTGAADRICSRCAHHSSPVCPFAGSFPKTYTQHRGAEHPQSCVVVATQWRNPIIL